MTVLKVAAALLQFAIVISSVPQTAPQSSSAVTTIAFDVSSIKENRSDGGRETFGFSGDRFKASNADLLQLIQMAYGLPPTPMNTARLIGAPGWLASVRYDIEAKVSEHDVPRLRDLKPEQQMLLLKPLLADRFRLQAHMETRDVPAYALLLSKGGSKLKEATEGDTFRVRPGELTAQSTSIAHLLPLLQTQVGRPVVDRTGLTGKYDVHLTFAPGSGVNAAVALDGSTQPSIFTALEEQLGLKLEPAKAAANFLVIDHIEKPSEN